MGEKQDTTQETSDLRKRAEAMLRQRGGYIADVSPKEAREILQELHTHQIELELQNEELRMAQEELIASRNRYSDLYDFSPVGYVTIDDKGMIVEVNLTLAGMLGMDRSELIRSPLSAAVAKQDQETYYRHRRNLLDTREGKVCELRMQRSDSSLFWAQLESIAVDDSGDRCDHIRLAVIDISERKNAEIQQIALERQVQQAQKLESMGILAGGIAHDFNNSLMVVRGNADLAMCDLPPGSPVRDSIAEILKASEHAAKLANQMLAYSGKGNFVIETVDLNEFIEGMSHLLDVSISKNTVLKYNLGDNMPTIDGDVSQLRQIIMNLIINASEAIGDEGGVITLSTGVINCDRNYLDDVHEILCTGLDEQLPEGRYAYLEVTDTGCGMEQEIVRKIFDPFFSTKFAGRGLGMSAVLGIVRGHKGAMRIYSEPGKGSRFKVLLPANEPSVNARERQGQDADQAKIWRGQGTILIADDEENVLSRGKNMLSRMGFDVLTASDGGEAVEIFRDRADEIDAVILDLTMPHMDGEQAFLELRRIRADAVVLLCSGYNEQDATRHFAGKGLAGFIQKPFGMGELRTKLKQVLAK